MDIHKAAPGGVRHAGPGWQGAQRERLRLGRRQLRGAPGAGEFTVKFQRNPAKSGEILVNLSRNSGEILAKFWRNSGKFVLNIRKPTNTYKP